MYQLAGNNKKLAKQIGSDMSPSKSKFYGQPGKEVRDEYKIRILGDDGRQIEEMHVTDHKEPHSHSNPHEHTIEWDENNNPQFSGPISNYQEE